MRPDGKPYVSVSLPTAGLASGTSVSNVVLKFRNPSRVKFTFAHQIYGAVLRIPERLSLVITSPAEGDSIDANATSVRGQFEGPDNAGITANGVIAAVHAGSFVANNVPLSVGDNTITVTATGPGGTQLTQSVTVESSGPSPFVLAMRPDYGIAPHKARFFVMPTGDTAVQGIDADFDGDGQSDYSTKDPNATVEFTYDMPGSYLPSFTVTDETGATRTLHQDLIVYSVSELDRKLQSVYTGMLDRLRVRDIDGALLAVTGTVRDLYRQAFTNLLPDIDGFLANAGTIEDGSISQEFAEYLLVRNTAEGRQGFLIYFLRSEDGVWRIDAM